MADILLNLIQYQAAGIADDEADIQQSLQALIRKHLKEVLNTAQLPPSNEEMGLGKCRLMA